MVMTGYLSRFFQITRYLTAAFTPFQRVAENSAIAYSPFLVASLRAYPFAALPLRRGCIPASSCFFCRLYRLTHLFTTYLSVNPKCSAISRFVFPARFIAAISVSTTCMCVYFLFMPKPPVVVIILRQGAFLHCPFLLVRGRPAPRPSLWPRGLTR